MTNTTAKIQPKPHFHPSPILQPFDDSINQFHHVEELQEYYKFSERTMVWIVLDWKIWSSKGGYLKTKFCSPMASRLKLPSSLLSISQTKQAKAKPISHYCRAI
jgi:hypothetical protein